MDLDAIPIINENDTVATKEIVIGDNDTLGAIVATTAKADLLIILSDIDGLYTADPHKDPNAKLLHRVEEITPEIEEMTGGAGASLVIETSGAAQALRDSIHATARYGRISIVSFYERELDAMPIDPLVLGCKALVGAAGCYGNAPEVCEIMRKNPIKLTPIITHHIPFENALDVFENEESYHNEKIKIMIDFE
jgi:threonine dehydrogenase-like Zn-dependent dehydrogenase